MIGLTTFSSIKLSTHCWQLKTDDQSWALCPLLLLMYPCLLYNTCVDDDDDDNDDDDDGGGRY